MFQGDNSLPLVKLSVMRYTTNDNFGGKRKKELRIRCTAGKKANKGCEVQLRKTLCVEREKKIKR
jgi:hypothetical protein